MTTATLSRTTHPAEPTTRTGLPTRSDGDQAVRRLRDLHAHAGQLVAGADWTPDVEGAVYDLSVEIRRTIDEISGTSTSGTSTSGTSTLVPSPPGSATPRVVRFRELGVLQRRLVGALRAVDAGSTHEESIDRATVRTSALVGVLAATLA